jgi:hypothetical protein
MAGVAEIADTPAASLRIDRLEIAGATLAAATFADNCRTPAISTAMLGVTDTVATLVINLLDRVHETDGVTAEQDTLAANIRSSCPVAADVTAVADIPAIAILEMVEPTAGVVDVTVMTDDIDLDSAPDIDGVTDTAAALATMRRNNCPVTDEVLDVTTTAAANCLVVAVVAVTIGVADAVATLADRLLVIVCETAGVVLVQDIAALRATPELATVHLGVTV